MIYLKYQIYQPFINLSKNIKSNIFSQYSKLLILHNMFMFIIKHLQLHLL